MQPCGLCHVGLFEKQSLPKSAGQINRTGFYKQDKNVMRRNIYRRITQEYFCMEEESSFSCERRWRSH